jgi:hypothetical protein
LFRAEEFFIIHSKLGLTSFIKKKEIEQFVKPTLLITVLNTPEFMKYLGVLGVPLDVKLIWWEHVRQRIIKEFSSFKLCHGTLVKIWGFKLKIMQWIYTNVTNPVLIHLSSGKTLI